MPQDISTDQDTGATTNSHPEGTRQVHFVGREREKELYRKFLTRKTPWVLIITGLGGIGKTTLLHELKAYTLRENSLSGASVVIVDFAKEKYRKHALNVLEKLTSKTAPDCDLQKMNGEFKDNLEKNLNQLAQLYTEKEQESIVESADGVQQEIQRQRRELALREIDHQRRELAAQLLYAQIETFTVHQLVIMLDTCELLNEPDGVEVGQWVMNELIPGLHTRMQQQGRQCSIVIASRVLPRLNIINQQEQRHLTLPMLDETAVSLYLEHVGMEDSSLRQYVFDITHGHALSVRLIGLIWENQGDKSLSAADLPVPLQAEFSEKALVQSMNERVLARLKSPFKELTEYAVLLRNFDLPMLQAIFPQWLPESEALERFNQLIRYPYIEPLGNYRYGFHELVREVLAEKVRDNEHEHWELYHKQALDYLTRVSPNSSDWYYHDLAYDEKQGILHWQKAIQAARGRSEQIGALLQAALDKTLTFTPGVHAEIAYENGRFKYYGAGAQWEEALKCYEDAFNSFAQVGDQVGQARSLQAMGDVQRVLGIQDVALISYGKALTSFAQVGDQAGQARILQAMGDIQRRNEPDTALQSYQRALDLFQKLNDEVEEAKVLRVIGDVQRSCNKFDAALRSYQQALALYQEEKDRLERARVLKTIGDVHRLRKDNTTAQENYEQALALFGELKEPTEEANVRRAIEEMQRPESVVMLENDWQTGYSDSPTIAVEVGSLAHSLLIQGMHAPEIVLNGPFGRVVLGSTIVTIGRSPGNQLLLNDPRVSSHHADIRPSKEGYTITDRGSTNGTLVNEQRIDANIPYTLSLGSRIQIGGTSFTYQLSDKPDAAGVTNDNIGPDSNATQQLMAPPLETPSHTRDESSYPTVVPPPPPEYSPYASPVPPAYTQSQTEYPTIPPFASTYGQSGAAYPANPSTPPAYGQPGAAYSANPSTPPAIWQPQLQAGYPFPQALPKRPSGSLRAAAFLFIVLVLILGTSGLIYFVTKSYSASTNLNTQATAAVQRALTVQAQPTVRAGNQATATANANPNPYPPYKGTVAFLDPLKDNSQALSWSVGTNELGATCRFTGGAYYVTQPHVGYFHACSAQSTNYSNFVFEVQMTLISGDYAGIIFRDNPANSSSYLFRVDLTGHYALLLYTANQNQTLLQGQAPVIGLKQAHLIAVVANNADISLYMDRQLLGRINDGTYTQGQIGVLVGNAGNNAVGEFRNAKVWTL